MAADNSDTLMRMAAFEHVRRLNEAHDHLTATELKPGFVFQGERIPLVNPQRGASMVSGRFCLGYHPATQPDHCAIDRIGQNSRGAARETG